MSFDPPVLEIPLWMISGAWIRVSCGCGRSTCLSTRLIPHEHADILVSDLLRRLRCQACGGRPKEAFYADRADTFARGGPGPGRRVWLLK